MRAVDVGGEHWSMRRQDWRRVVENEAVRSAARTSEIGGKDWKVRRRDRDQHGGANRGEIETEIGRDRDQDRDCIPQTHRYLLGLSHTGVN
ncbi:hypothetical protein CMV_016055 [Castanea mollissima]|uniref:Uncharacterized protein n=1 Tax=Castanea mollissima TaxID=60419 RepID=A0A8J4R4D3_9ROSI|nr:hypothetical protein CMV_016055 [Castanea mollissima]